MLSPPRIVCAANRFEDTLIPSARHWDMMMHNIARKLFKDGYSFDWGRGFVDQHGTFYNREDAYVIAKANNQIIRDDSHCYTYTPKLYSENLY